MLHEAKIYLWSPILSSWLCGVMGLQMTIALVGWDEIIGKCFVHYVYMIY